MGNVKHYDSNKLLKKMQRLGYNINPDGVCAGATMVALESFVNHGNIQEFESAIEFIHSDDFKPKKMKSNNKLFPPAKDQKSLDALATLDQIHLYHKPEMYHALFTQTFSQYESHKIAMLAQSNKSITNQGFITRDNWSWSGIYNYSKLKALLNEIKDASTIDQLLALKIGNIEHKIALTYKDGIWTLIDINRMPSSTFTSTSKLAKRLLKILALEESNTATFTATAYTAGINAEQTQQFFDTLFINPHFKKQHRISKKTIRNDDVMQLAQLAICNHQPALLTELITQGINVNAIMPSGVSMVYLAAQYGFTDILNLLINAGAKINTKEGKHGFSPLLIAIRYQHHDAISLLINHGATINDENNDHVTPIVMAANNGDIDSLKLLTSHGAKLNESSFFGTPAEVARNAGKTDAAEYIEKQLSHPAG